MLDHDLSALRDHFAGLAMQAMLSNDNLIGAKMVDIARLAYKQADAMLAAREGGDVASKQDVATSSDGWVSVLDRMPDESGWYEVFVEKTEFGGGGGGCIVDFWSADDGRWKALGGVVFEIPCYVESVITHWRGTSSSAPTSNASISDEERDKIIAALKKAQKNVSS